jgi:hypothetical protein
MGRAEKRREIMDPNVALEHLRRLMGEVEELLPGPEMQSTELEDKIGELLDQMEAIDTWLSMGGFKPSAWDAPAS